MFHAFNFHISQAIRKYFNNEIFAICGIILYIEYFQPSNIMMFKGCMAGARQELASFVRPANLYDFLNHAGILI